MYLLEKSTLGPLENPRKLKYFFEEVIVVLEASVLEASVLEAIEKSSSFKKFPQENYQKISLKILKYRFLKSSL